VHQGRAAGERTVHYVYERDSFVPLVQATRNRAIRLAPTTDVKALMAGNDGKYDIALDPLWNGEYEREAEPFGKEEIAFYQCDHLGTPQELTDHEGKVAWSAQYKAWGQAKEAISEAARKAGIRNPIRFQGQYFDDETGLHYNRHRYYDPDTARYLSQDSVGLAGGINPYRYAPNPISWIDPLGLTACCLCTPYAGVKNASQHLKEAGISRGRRKEILESFDRETINMRAAGENEYGLRYYDGTKAHAKGRYLFETFPATRESLAVKREWNDMNKVQQWKIEPGEPMIEGRASSQGPSLPGGQVQKFILDLNKLIKP
jgi:RHS repeat-associated protein